MPSRISILDERCKGCLLCTTVCPKRLLRPSQTLNRQGYRVVEAADMDLCTGCASCALICPDVAIRVFTTRKGKEQNHE